MKKLTRAELEERLSQESRDHTSTSIALNAVIEGRVEWIGHKNGAFSLGVVEPNWPHGGIIIQRYNPGGQKPYSSVHYWDLWYPSIRDLDSQYPEATLIRDLAFRAHEIIIKAQSKAA